MLYTVYVHYTATLSIITAHNKKQLIQYSIPIYEPANFRNKANSDSIGKTTICSLCTYFQIFIYYLFYCLISWAYGTVSTVRLDPWIAAKRTFQTNLNFFNSRFLENSKTKLTCSKNGFFSLFFFRKERYIEKKCSCFLLAKKMSG